MSVVLTYVFQLYHTFQNPVNIKCMTHFSSNAGEVYYVIKSVSDLRQVGGFLGVLWVSSTKKNDRHAIGSL
jgi:hypothetical protein